MNRSELAEVSDKELAVTQGASIFEDSRANLTAFENLYGSYHLDEKFPANRKKIREFIALLEKRKIFERRDERGLAFYLSSLK